MGTQAVPHGSDAAVDDPALAVHFASVFESGGHSDKW